MMGSRSPHDGEMAANTQTTATHGLGGASTSPVYAEISDSQQMQQPSPPQEQRGMDMNVAQQLGELRQQLTEVIQENERLHTERVRLIERQMDPQEMDRLTETTATLESEIAILKERNVALETELQTQDRLLSQKREQLASAKAELTSVKSQLHRRQIESERMQAEQSRLLRENARLSAELEVAPKDLPRDRCSAAFGDHGDGDGDGDSTLQATRTRLERALKEMAQKHLEEVGALKEDMYKLDQQRRSANDKTVEATARMTEAATLIAALRDKLASSQREQHRVAERCAKLELEVEDARTEKQAFATHLQSVLQVVDKRQAELLQLQRFAAQSKKERDRALIQASQQDALVQQLNQQLLREQQTSRAQLLKAVSMVQQISDA
eukprot:m.268864 g.268864  ORF g.268864 m.268864 type:complete len:383 (+) comp15663_c0_seq1:34-1182(+)